MRVKANGSKRDTHTHEKMKKKRRLRIRRAIGRIDGIGRSSSVGRDTHSIAHTTRRSTLDAVKPLPPFFCQSIYDATALPPTIRVAPSQDMCRSSNFSTSDTFQDVWSTLIVSLLDVASDLQPFRSLFKASRM